MEIINFANEDYHVNSLNFFDGMSTVDEIVKFAGVICIDIQGIIPESILKNLLF